MTTNPSPAHNLTLLPQRLALFLRQHAVGLGYLGITLLCYFQFFAGIGGYGIINGNESLYVESAREMAQTGQWAVPTLNGLPYLEKPPLLIWLMTLSQHLFGMSEVSARLVTSFAATSTASRPCCRRPHPALHCGLGVPYLGSSDGSYQAAFAHA